MKRSGPGRCGPGLCGGDMTAMLDREQINRILVRSTNWLGDAVMTTPAISAIRESFPGAHISILATPLVAEMFTRHADVDEVIVYDRRGRHGGFRGKFRIAAELRERKFDLAILLQNAIDAAIITFLAGIPQRMGYRTDGRGFLLTHGCPVTPETGRLHHVDYYLAMLGMFGITTSVKRQRLTVAPEESDSVDGLLSPNGIARSDFVLGVNPGATYGSAKRWYPDRFAAVADRLSAEWGARVVITGGPGEAAIAADIEREMTHPCLNMAGKTTVRELMALIERCDFFISNDSGPMHMAAAFDVPVVAVFGPTDHATTSPFSSKMVIVRKETACAPCMLRECPTDHRCMTAVTVVDVVRAAITLKETIIGRNRP